MKYFIKILIPFLLLLTAFFGGVWAERSCFKGSSILISGKSFSEKEKISNNPNQKKKRHEKRLRRQHEKLKRKLINKLSLSSKQVVKLDVILENKKNDLRVIREEIHPKMKAHQEDFKEKVHSILSDQQKHIFKQMKLERKHKGHGKGRKKRRRSFNRELP